MNNEPNKPIQAQELTEKELEGVVGGRARPVFSSDDMSVSALVDLVDGFKAPTDVLGGGIAPRGACLT